jgi:FtsP/CotA-like multicopper oxidase with cupredoxin domain
MVKKAEKNRSEFYKAGFFIVLALLLSFLVFNFQLKKSNINQRAAEGDVQIIQMKVEGIDYVPSELTVEKGRPVKFIVDGTNAVDCVQYFTIPVLGINTKLKQGDNVFEFTPEEVGDIPFSCAMQMARGVIRVVEKKEKKEGTEKQDKKTSYNEFQVGLNSGENLPASRPSEVIEIIDNDTTILSAGIVEKKINNVSLKMYAYNGMIPGPVLKVKQGTRFKLIFFNNIDQNTTVHWHGLRQNVKDDGVPGTSQSPIIPNGNFTYDLYFPDAGVFWYHPHIREDIQQEAGLAANIIVVPTITDYYNSANKEEILVLDDILIQDNNYAPFGKEHTTYAIMGRFGNIMLLNGKTDYRLDAKRGEVIRFFITNVANVRPFNFSIKGARMKLIGSDLGKYEHEKFVDNLIITPAERYIVEAYFEKSGEYKVENINPHTTYTLGKIIVSDEKIDNDNSAGFKALNDNQDVIKDISAFRKYFDKPADYSIELTVDMPSMIGGMMQGMMEHVEETKGIEWEDTMKMMNERFDSSEVKWQLKDKKTGMKNMDFRMNAKKGDQLKISFFNNPKSMHPMQHPIHLHGQRFLVLSENGVQNKNLVWKDTVLVPVGSTIDILVDVTNPGEWMMHCHIAEHLESGMMTALKVE